MDKSIEAAIDAAFEYTRARGFGATTPGMVRAAIAAYRDAEIERLTAENTEIRDACEKACQSLILVMNDRDDLRAKLEAAERDAERAASKEGRHAD